MPFGGKINKRKSSGIVLAGTLVGSAICNVASQGFSAAGNNTAQISWDVSGILSFLKKHWFGTLGVSVIALLGIIGVALFCGFFAKKTDEEKVEELERREISTPVGDKRGLTKRKESNDLASSGVRKEGDLWKQVFDNLEVTEDEENITVVLNDAFDRQGLYSGFKFEKKIGKKALSFIQGIYRCIGAAKYLDKAFRLVYNKKDGSFKVLDDQGNIMKSASGEELTFSSEDDVGGEVKFKDVFLEKFGSEMEGKNNLNKEKVFLD